MRIKYFGPSPAINVCISKGYIISHVKGQIIDYPKTIGEDLLAGKKNDFRIVNGETPKELRSQRFQKINPKH